MEYRNVAPGTKQAPDGAVRPIDEPEVDWHSGVVKPENTTRRTEKEWWRRPAPFGARNL